MSSAPKSEAGPAQHTNEIVQAAAQAIKPVEQASAEKGKHTSTDATQEFAKNADYNEGNDDENDKDDEDMEDDRLVPMNIDPLVADAFRADIHRQAKDDVLQLISNPENAAARNNIHQFNVQIKTRNQFENYPPDRMDDFLIDLEVLLPNMEIAQSLREKVARDPDQELREQLIKQCGIVNQLIALRGYPEDWSINAPEEAASTGGAASMALDDSPSGPDNTGVTADKGKGPEKPCQTTVPPDQTPSGASDKGQRGYTDEQKNAVNRVLKCGPNQYYKILGLKDPSTKEESKKAYKKLSLLLHPDKNKYKDAGEAFKLVDTAAKALRVESEDFAENAYEEGNAANDDDVVMGPEQGEAAKPDEFRLNVYNEATQYLEQLRKNPTDADARTKLNGLNKQIFEQNLKDRLPRIDIQDCLIKVPTFVANFQLAKPYYDALQKDPTDEIAREKLTNINKTLDQLNERHGYPRTWLISIPPSPVSAAGPGAAESSGATGGTTAAGKGGQASTQRGVKTKVSVPIPDESDGRTSLGKVRYVRKAGRGWRVIVNRGTEANPYYDIYPGGEFGKGVAKEWETDAMYACEDLPKDTKATELRIYGRVKVKRTTQKRKTKTARTQSQIQYYLIRVQSQEYVSTRTALSGLKGLSLARLKRIDAQLDVENEQLLAELDECREKNEHPDTGEQLTEADIKEMPWLSPDVIINNDDDSDDDDEDDVGNIVPQRSGLKRTPRPKTASRTPN